MKGSDVHRLTDHAGSVSETARHRTSWLGTSWKMNKTRAEACSYATVLTKWVEAWDAGVTIFVVPPYTALASVCEIARGGRLKVGAQNMHWADSGAHTGEISPLMVKDCGADLVELGHFERREEFGENDFTINKKVHAALEHGLLPLVCVGETEVERDYGVAGDAVSSQVRIALHGVPTDRMDEVLIAYEPGWAIGDGGTEASPDYVSAFHARIRAVIAEQHGEAIAERVPVLYGGSVTASNAAAFARLAEVSGLFIGRAGWEVASFIEIISTFCDATRSAPSENGPINAHESCERIATDFLAPGTLIEPASRGEALERCSGDVRS